MEIIRKRGSKECQNKRNQTQGKLFIQKLKGILEMVIGMFAQNAIFISDGNMIGSVHAVEGV